MPYSRTAIITFLDGNAGLSPDQGLPPSYGGRPDNSLPGYPGRPDNSLPGLPPGAVQLPVFPFDPTRPDNSLPGSGGSVDNSLPGSQPGVDNSLPTPGRRYIVKWLACVGLILVPDNSLPTNPAEPK